MTKYAYEREAPKPKPSRRIELEREVFSTDEGRELLKIWEKEYVLEGDLSAYMNPTLYHCGYYDGIRRMVRDILIHFRG